MKHSEYLNAIKLKGNSYFRRVRVIWGRFPALIEVPRQEFGRVRCQELTFVK